MPQGSRGAPPPQRLRSPAGRFAGSRFGPRWVTCAFCRSHEGRVVEAEQYGDRAELSAELAAWLVRGVWLADDGPVHLQVLLGQSRDRVREFHRGDTVPHQQPTPAERGEYVREGAHRQGAPA